MVVLLPDDGGRFRRDIEDTVVCWFIVVYALMVQHFFFHGRVLNVFYWVFLSFNKYRVNPVLDLLDLTRWQRGFFMGFG